MPIKLPRGFQRRKSSGNALDEVQNPPAASSFRVIERPDGKSFDGGRALRSAGAGPPTLNAKNSFYHDEEDLFSVARPDATNRYGGALEFPLTLMLYRGSGGTENSLSTSHYDSNASSTRLSTSTTPSSIDNRSDRNVQATYKDIPVPPPPSARPGFLRNSARTFSLGVGLKSSKEPQFSSPAASPAPAIHPANSSDSRGRALTASSASTATPPKLFDSDLALDNSELDGFGNMFDGIGLKSSRDASPRSSQNVRSDLNKQTLVLTKYQAFSSSPPSYPPTSFPGVAPLRNSRAPAPIPIYTARNDAIESSPYSWTSQDSRDGLMRSPSPSKTITQHSPPIRYGAANSATPRGNQRKPVPPPKHEHSYEDSLSQMPSRSPRTETSLLKIPSNQSDQQDGQFDPTLVAHAELANRYQDAKPNTSRQGLNNKVMTPAQFERYKKQQEMDRRLGASGDSDSEEEVDNYDDDDDVEKEKLATQQRRKQEAHLAVYRQQMMKVTGEQAPQRSASSFSNTLDPRLSASTPELNNRFSHMTASTKLSSKSSGEEEEEDEDVPLGILAAHGFPNKTRPPTQLVNSSSNPNLRGLAQQQQPAASVAGGESMKRGSLPVFARQLPQDPYYGASLVNQSNRESLAMHNSSLAPMAGSVAATAHPHHPAGLVGVIVGEEKARAMRRGSPNTQGNYDLPPGMQHPGMMRSQTTGNIPQMPFPGMMPPMPMMSPGDHAQIQMSQQMTQMMQMQMQWMQQMSQMMGGQMSPGQQMPQMPPGQGPNFLAPPGGAGRPPSISPTQGRAMSTISPSMANWNLAPQGNYAHSIAPSERSNVGLASRYRPVSVAQDSEMTSARRASTFTSSSVRPFSQIDPSPRLSSHMGKQPVNQVGRRSPLAGDEDDDEQGWAEMKAKKDKKTRTWKMRKERNTLKELYNGVA